MEYFTSRPMQMSCNWISFKFPIFLVSTDFFSTCAPTHEDSGESNYRGECRVCHGPHGMSSGRSAHQVPPVGLGDLFVNLTFRIVSGWWVHRGRNHPTWRMMRATLQRHIERWRLSLFFFPRSKGRGFFEWRPNDFFFFFKKRGTYERLMMFHLHHADQFQLAADVRQCLERSLCKFVRSSGQFCWKNDSGSPIWSVWTKQKQIDSSWKALYRVFWGRDDPVECLAANSR